jgi:HK97 family phage major capsid protein
MENQEKLVNITETQLESTINKAVDKAKDEFARTQIPFGKSFRMEKSDESNPQLLGALVRANITANQKGVSLQDGAKIYNDKSKTYASEIILKSVNETTDNEGAYLTIPEVYNSILETLKPLSIFRSLPGIKQINVNAAQFEIPTMTTGATAYWVNEQRATATINAERFGKITLNPKALISWSKLTKDLINDSAFNAEQFIQNEIIRQIAVTEDAAFLTGLGASNQPKGLYSWLNAANVTTSGGTTTELYEADFFTAETDIRGANIMGNLVWIMNYTTYSSLRTKLRVTTGQVAWPELRDTVPTLLGYPVKFSNTTSNPSSKIFLFAPEHFMIADRTGINVMINPVQNDANFPVGINETLIAVEKRVDCALLYDLAGAVIE